MLIPMNLIIYFDLVNSFIENGPDTIMSKIRPITIRAAIFASISIVIPFVQMVCLKISAKRQVRRMRILFLKVSAIKMFSYHCRLANFATGHNMVRESNRQ